MRVNGVKIDSTHIENISSILYRTYPYQPYILQTCLKRALRESEFIRYDDFDRMMLNIGVKLGGAEEKKLKELLMDRKLMRIRDVYDSSSDVHSAHSVHHRYTKDDRLYRC